MSSTIEHAVRRRTQHPLSFMPSYPFPWWPWQWRAFCQNVAFITFSNHTISNKNNANKGLIWVQQEMPYCCAFIYHIFWYNVHSYMYNSPAPAGFPHQDLGSEINLLRDWPTVGDFLITRTCCPERMGWQQQPKQRGILSCAGQAVTLPAEGLTFVGHASPEFPQKHTMKTHQNGLWSRAGPKTIWTNWFSRKNSRKIVWKSRKQQLRL